MVPLVGSSDESTECYPSPYSFCPPSARQCHRSSSNMRRCQEVLARVGVHGASLTATVSRIAEILPLEQAHINPRILVQDTSVSTDLAIHPSLRTACDTALRHSPKACAQALHSRISALEQCEPDPSIQNEDPAHIPTLLTPDSPLGARYSSIRTPSFPPPPQVHKPFKPKRLRRPPLLFPLSRPSVSCPSTRQRARTHPRQSCIS